MIRGEKFEVDLGSDDEQDAGGKAGPLPGLFVGDVLERQPTSPKPPAAPTLKSKSGFPEHKKRPVESRFKQRRVVEPARSTPANQTVSPDEGLPVAAKPEDGGESRSWEEEERDRIDQENRQKLAEMSPAEIEQERQELMNSLSPALIQRLLQRSNIDSGSNETDLSQRPERPTSKPDRPKANKSVTFAEVETDVHDKGSVANDLENRAPPPDQPLPHDSVHFPRPHQPPDLDPSSATFLQDLHSKYFPSLPSEPDKLEWMQPPTTTKTDYDPAATAFNAKDLRFSFKGELIPPRTALDIPVTAGLHHHGDAPDAAGYTIPELAHLSCSSYAAQRCIPFQTLGRFLFRLGKGEFGDAGEPGADSVGARDTFGELARGLWGEVEREKVIETLVRESEGQGVDGGRHVSAKAYATEAVWLWQKGGGRRWKAN